MVWNLKITIIISYKYVSDSVKTRKMINVK